MTALLSRLFGVALLNLPLTAMAGERVVIAGASFVEIAYALGAGKRVVGVDQTATHPAETAAAANIGYFRRLAPEGVLALAPDLVIAAADAGPPRTFDILESADVAVLRGPEADTPDEVASKIRFMGEALGLVPQVDALATDYETRLAAVRSRLPDHADPPRVLFVLAIQGGAPLVVERGTAADAMPRTAGLANAADAVDGFQPMDPGAILAAAPEALLMMPEWVGARFCETVRSAISERNGNGTCLTKQRIHPARRRPRRHPRPSGALAHPGGARQAGHDHERRAADAVRPPHPQGDRHARRPPRALRPLRRR